MQTAFRKALIVSAGWLAFAAGSAGIFIPGLPTTIFWILAALAFVRTNRRMYERIVGHPHFGRPIKLFVEEGKMDRRGKVIAITAMTASALLSVLLIPILWVKLLVVAVVLAGVAWIATRPSIDPGRGLPEPKRAS